MLQRNQQHVVALQLFDCASHHCSLVAVSLGWGQLLFVSISSFRAPRGASCSFKIQQTSEDFAVIIRTSMRLSREAMSLSRERRVRGRIEGQKHASDTRVWKDAHPCRSAAHFPVSRPPLNLQSIRDHGLQN